MFSVPGVRKLALQSAVPMANVVTRPRGSLTEENLLPDLTGTVSVFKIPMQLYIFNTAWFACYMKQLLNEFEQDMRNY